MRVRRPPADIAFACRCGALHGHLRQVTKRTGTRIVCHCNDCRALQVVLGRPDPGYEDGVDIFQTLPAGVDIDDGWQHLAALRLGPKGLLRWYAACCGTPLAATLPKRTLPFVGWLTATLSDARALGPVRAHGFLRRPDGQGLTHKGTFHIATGMFGRAGGAFLNRTAKNTPFFDTETGAPVVVPEVIAQDRRDAAYSVLRP